MNIKETQLYAAYKTLTLDVRTHTHTHTQTESEGVRKDTPWKPNESR